METVIHLHQSFWSPPRTGHWQTDTEIGRDHAEDVIIQFRNGEIPANRLGVIVREIIRRGEFTGVEAGFFQRIAEELG